MNGLVIQINGDKQVIENLKDLEPRMRRLAITRSMRAALKPVLATARQMAPKKTEKLRKNIKLKMWKRSRSKEAKRNPKIGMSIQVGDGWYKGDTFYGAFQEFGWHTGKRTNAIRRRRGTDTRRWIEGKHFMEQTFDIMGEHALRVMYSQMPTEIAKLKFKMAQAKK